MPRAQVAQGQEGAMDSFPVHHISNEPDVSHPDSTNPYPTNGVGGDSEPIQTGNITPEGAPVEMGNMSGGEWQQRHSSTDGPKHNINQGSEQ